MAPKKILLVLTSVSLLAACAKQAPPAQSADSPSPAAPAQRAQAPKSPPDSQLVLSNEIRDKCGIQESEAYFAYNSAQVKSSADETLRKVAVCFTTGPLKGRTLALVGHADPRGEVEYNFVLGERRADGIKRRLTGFGLPESQATTTSRGELDARGVDETGWSSDRRVDMELSTES